MGRPWRRIVGRRGGPGRSGRRPGPGESSIRQKNTLGGPRRWPRDPFPVNAKTLDAPSQRPHPRRTLESRMSTVTSALPVGRYCLELRPRRHDRREPIDECLRGEVVQFELTAVIVTRVKVGSATARSIPSVGRDRELALVVQLHARNSFPVGRSHKWITLVAGCVPRGNSTFPNRSSRSRGVTQETTPPRSWVIRTPTAKTNFDLLDAGVDGLRRDCCPVFASHW